MTDDFENLQKKLQKALTEIEQLRQENAQLKTVFKESPSPSVIKPKVKVHQPASALSPINHQSPVEEKISLFRRLFRGREDVYPKRWESKNNNSGYSPVCSNDDDRTNCFA
jgi:hypothetical protein